MTTSPVAVLDGLDMRRSLGLALCALQAVACAGEPRQVRAALYGDLAGLGKEIDAARARGDLSDPAALRELAAAVARREVRSAEGAGTIQQIRAARACVRAVEPELLARAEADDDAAGEALVVLFEGGRADGDELVRRHRASRHGALRAAAARAARGPDHGDVRRHLLVDPDERARREALRAAREAGDPADVPVLLEVARRDPAPGNRSLAVAALGGLGGAGVTRGLGDLWPAADEGLRLAIVEAWASDGLREDGGRSALLRAAEADSGRGGLLAALALLGEPGEASDRARALVLEALRGASTERRSIALTRVPLSDAELLAAVVDASRGDDPSVAAVAAARLTERPELRGAALLRLRALAAGDDGAARQARVALSHLADRSPRAPLERDLADPHPDRRRRAALALFRLGLAEQMASALADRDPRVRMGVACGVLAPGSG